MRPSRRCSGTCACMHMTAVPEAQGPRHDAMPCSGAILYTVCHVQPRSAAAHGVARLWLRLGTGEISAGQALEEMHSSVRMLSSSTLPLIVLLKLPAQHA